MQVGRAKDAIAALIFFVSMIVLSTRNVPLGYIFGAVLMGFIVDLMFTLRPTWHCEDWEESRVAKYIVMFQIPAFCVILTSLYF